MQAKISKRMPQQKIKQRRPDWQARKATDAKGVSVPAISMHAAAREEQSKAARR